MTQPTDPYLRGLLEQDKAVIHTIYRDFAPAVAALVVKNGGQAGDSRDVMQEALIVIWRKAREPDFILTSSFKTYLLSICRFIWLRHRKKKDNNTVTTEALTGLSVEHDVQRELEISDRRRLFERHLATLSQDCRQLLRLHFIGISMREISLKLGIASEHAARNRKYRCQKKLEGRILDDPEYREHLNE